MIDELKQYKNQGHFFFKPGDSLKTVSKDVPDLPGVYFIYRLSRGRVEIVYIEEAGIMLQNGAFEKHGLKSGLNSKHDGMTKQNYFDMFDKLPEWNKVF